MSDATDALTDRQLETDLVGLIIDCPWLSEDLNASWFTGLLQKEAVMHIQANGREGLTNRISQMFSMERRSVYNMFDMWRKAAREHLPATLMPKHAERLRDLSERRETMAEATALAQTALLGVSMAG